MMRTCDGDDQGTTWDVALDQIEACMCGRTYDDAERVTRWPHARRVAVLRGQLREAAERDAEVTTRLG